MLVIVLSLIGCGRTAGTESSNDRIATRVAEELAVAATLTASAPTAPPAATEAREEGAGTDEPAGPEQQATIVLGGPAPATELPGTAVPVEASPAAETPVPAEQPPPLPTAAQPRPTPTAAQFEDIEPAPDESEIPRIDWGLFTEYFTVSDVRIERGRQDRIPGGQIVVYDALVFTVEARSDFQNWAVVFFAHFYDAEDIEVGVPGVLVYEPDYLQWARGTRSRAYFALPPDLSLVEVIRIRALADEPQ
ncbi:MAG TPA: hypothetical protein VER55_14265 [Ardenticatenaceae bacterium]|nr:hypothetical protein [Ardenticatenaceae bacterium]